MVKRTYKTSGVIRLRKKMQLQTAALLILIQFSWVATGFYQLSKEMDFSVPVVEAREIEKEPSMSIWVLQQFANAGLNPEEAAKIINYESKWNPDFTLRNNDKVKSFDRGLMALNSYWHREITNKCAYDYHCAVEASIKIRLREGSWKSWFGAGRIGIR